MVIFRNTNYFKANLPAALSENSGFNITKSPHSRGGFLWGDASSIFMISKFVMISLWSVFCSAHDGVLAEC